MSDDELQQLESRLASMQPVVPSMIARERLRVSVARSEARSGVWYRLASAAAIVLLVSALVAVLIPTRTVTRSPAPGSVVQSSDSYPTLAAYQRAAEASDEQLDALLARHSARALPAPSRALSNDSI